MTIYVAGPISGRPKYNRPQFEEARREIEAKGHTALIPHDYTEGLLHLGCPALIWCLSMCKCVDVLLSCDAVLFLEGWEHSAGARREHDLAMEHGKTIYYYSLP